MARADNIHYLPGVSRAPVRDETSGRDFFAEQLQRDLVTGVRIVHEDRFTFGIYLGFVLGCLAVVLGAMVWERML